jgi:predicted Zn-dependent peptidase
MSTTTSLVSKTIAGDPLQVRIYTLRNGMTLFLSVNPEEPRIHTNIVVRAGSKQDPADATGLAHYMEHMLFKGTSRIGALDWAQESKYLEQISDLYEQHRTTKDKEERRRIYQEIDRLSNEAAKLVAPNEYDLLSGAIGAKDTNAYTSVDQTVYINDIPGNELERWMRLESERFRMMALRLFHTELETVYEEFNIGQDQDNRKINRMIREALFPNHPYGTQTTIGSAEHLRNPSQKKIQEFFRTYYVPNNMALVLSGDFDPEQAVAMAEAHFGVYEPGAVPPFSYEPAPPIQEPVRMETWGQEAPFVDIAWRFQGASTDDPMMLSLIQNLLSNYQAGLLDLNLNQRQRVLDASAWIWQFQDYSALGLVARPREGQSMEAVEELLLQEIQRLREGDFADWMLEAAIRDIRLREVKLTESNRGRVGLITQAFVLGIGWDRMVSRFDWWEKVTKEEVVAFAQAHIGENRIVAYKQQGEDPDVLKVEKPPINSVELQRNRLSEYAQDFLSVETPPLEPVFADFEKGIHRLELQPGLNLEYVHNYRNELFRLDYVFELNKLTDRTLSMAIAYLPYLGTPRYSAAELQRQFFRLGLSFDVHVNNDYTYLTVSGLSESMTEGIRLMEHVMEHLQPDEAALVNMKADVIKRRQHAKQNRNFVLRRAMGSYARYGEQSPFLYRLDEQEVQELDSHALISRLQNLSQYEHRVHYYGPEKVEKVVAAIQQYHKRADQLKPVPESQSFEQPDTNENEVLFLDFPIVQADVMLVSRGTPNFNLDEFQLSEWYNEYFGYGLSSIVFQEIRESRALAYSAFAYYSSPDRPDQPHYLQAYLGTQPDKLQEAIPALTGILHDMPLLEGQAEQARHSILRRIESERIVPGRYFWESLTARRLGFDKDMREDLYTRLKDSSLKDLTDFQQQHVRDRAYKYVVLGSADRMDWAALEQVGPIRKLSMEEVFGY